MGAPPELPSRVGACIAGRYTLSKVIGRGGMSTVYEAEHVVTHRRVAVKTIDASVALSVPTIALRFLREARAAATIRHPGLVDVLDAGQEDDGSLYLVLELLEGEDVERALRNAHVDPPDVVDVVIEVLDALEAMHAAGFVHRDVKPANLFLAEARDGSRRVKLLDLGIAKQIGGASASEITAHGVLLGTLHFMSPEQALGGEVDARADVWGIGATLFYAWAGRPPFMRAAPAELLRALLEEPPPAIASLVPSIPPDLASVIDRALERSPTRRYADAAAMRRALERARGAPRPRYESIDVPDTQELAPAREPGRPWGLTVAGAVLAAAGVSWALWPSAASVRVEPASIAGARAGEDARASTVAAADGARAGEERRAAKDDRVADAEESRTVVVDGVASEDRSADADAIEPDLDREVTSGVRRIRRRAPGSNERMASNPERRDVAPRVSGPTGAAGREARAGGAGERGAAPRGTARRRAEDPMRAYE